MALDEEFKKKLEAKAAEAKSKGFSDKEIQEYVDYYVQKYDPDFGGTPYKAQQPTQTNEPEKKKDNSQNIGSGQQDGSSSTSGTNGQQNDVNKVPASNPTNNITPQGVPSQTSNAIKDALNMAGVNVTPEIENKFNEGMKQVTAPSTTQGNVLKDTFEAGTGIKVTKQQEQQFNEGLNNQQDIYNAQIKANAPLQTQEQQGQIALNKQQEKTDAENDSIIAGSQTDEENAYRYSVKKNYKLSNEHALNVLSDPNNANKQYAKDIIIRNLSKEDDKNFSNDFLLDAGTRTNDNNLTYQAGYLLSKRGDNNKALEVVKSGIAAQYQSNIWGHSEWEAQNYAYGLELAKKLGFKNDRIDKEIKDAKNAYITLRQERWDRQNLETIARLADEMSKGEGVGGLISGTALLFYLPNVAKNAVEGTIEGGKKIGEGFKGEKESKFYKDVSPGVKQLVKKTEELSTVESILSGVLGVWEIGLSVGGLLLPEYSGALGITGKAAQKTLGVLMPGTLKFNAQLAAVNTITGSDLSGWVTSIGSKLATENGVDLNNVNASTKLAINAADMAGFVLMHGMSKPAIEGVKNAVEKTGGSIYDKLNSYVDKAGDKNYMTKEKAIAEKLMSNKPLTVDEVKVVVEAVSNTKVEDVDKIKAVSEIVINPKEAVNKIIKAKDSKEGNKEVTNTEAVSTSEGDRIFAYDYHDTLVDTKTGKLTKLGEQVKERIANGEDIHILTAGEGTPDLRNEIKEKLGISDDRLQTDLTPEGKAEAVKKLQDSGKVVEFTDNNVKNRDAVLQTGAKVFDEVGNTHGEGANEGAKNDTANEPVKSENVQLNEQKTGQTVMDFTTENTVKEVAPKEGDTITMDSIIKGGQKREMIFKDGEWKQKVGNDIVEISNKAKSEANEKFVSENKQSEQAPTEPQENKVEPQQNEVAPETTTETETKKEKNRFEKDTEYSIEDVKNILKNKEDFEALKNEMEKEGVKLEKGCWDSILKAWIPMGITTAAATWKLSD